MPAAPGLNISLRASPAVLLAAGVLVALPFGPARA